MAPLEPLLKLAWFAILLHCITAEIKVKSDKEMQFLIEGDDLVMQCSTAGVPAGTELKFSKQDTPMDKNIVNDGRTNVTTTKGETPTIKVTIKNVVPGDSGAYTCTTVQDVDDLTDAWVTVEIMQKASVPVTQTKGESSLSWELGSLQKLTCLAKYVESGNVKKVKYEWTFPSNNKSKSVVVSETKIDSVKSGNSTMQSNLTVTSASPVHGGTYSCQPISVLTDGTSFYHSKTNFTVASVAPATEVQSLAEEVNAASGSNVALECSVDMYPLPVIAWRLIIEDDDVNKKIVASAKYVMSPKDDGAPANKVLTITDVNNDDRAKYVCEIDITADNRMVKQAFQLRTRSSTGLVWPLLGIVLEAIILAVIIVACDKIKAKKAKRDGVSKPLVTTNA